MSLKSIIEIIITALLLIWGFNFVLTKLIIDNKRDLSDIALNEQSNITSVRKNNETALYRNFLVPIGFPLTTGLGLSLGYKIRNGNFMDVWKAIMDVTVEKKNFIKFLGEKYTIPQLNGMANHIMETVYEKYDAKQVGVNISTSTHQGFVISIASMIYSIKNANGNGLLHYLTSVPRQRMEDIDVLVIDSWQSFRMLNNSENWYKLIIVCDDNNSVLKPDNLDQLDNVKTWKQIITGYSSEAHFIYEPPKDNSDELKLLLNITTSANKTSSFNQLNLVSSISAFIKTFPLNNELTSMDNITQISDSFAVAKTNLQIWPKLLAVLLHGGSAQLLTENSFCLDDIKDTTLLVATPSAISTLAKNIESGSISDGFCASIRQSIATSLLSEGIMTKLAKFDIPQLSELRAIYLVEELSNESQILSFNYKIPEKSPSRQINGKITSTKLNYFRAIFGSRLIVELYCPYIIMGPISQTNFFDYRIFPKVVDNNVTCVGSMTTTLEAKMIATENNADLDIEKRQGMLCVRGFTIGRPISEERLALASKLSNDIAGGEGWIPLVGVFGLWGQDGCLYIYN